MRLSQISIISGAVISGVVFGLILAPSLRKTGPVDFQASPRRSAAADPRTSGIMDASANSPARTRLKDRESAKKADEPRISIPVKTVVGLLHDGSLSGSDFKRLEKSVGLALETLGASQTESDEIKDLIKKSKDEINAAEKTHFKVGLVTPDHIEIDTSGIREPVSAIIGRLQNDIRATLSSEAAEVLISAIDWKFYYRIDENALITSLEIDRNEAGELMAQVKTGGGCTGWPVNKKFPDDGSPLPADQVFPELWRPYLRGLTIVPKNAR